MKKVPNLCPSESDDLEMYINNIKKIKHNFEKPFCGLQAVSNNQLAVLFKQKFKHVES